MENAELDLVSSENDLIIPEALARLINQACDEVEEEDRIYGEDFCTIGIDWSSLDLKFLPYFLTTERIEIEWKEGTDLMRLDGRDLKRFYVGIEFSEGWVSQGSGEIMPHHVNFVRRKNYNSIQNVEFLESEHIGEIRGLGKRPPYFKDMNMGEVALWQVRKLNWFKFMSRYWYNYVPVINAIKEFYKEML